MAPNANQTEQIEEEIQESIHAGQKLAFAPAGDDVCITGISGKFPDSDSIVELKEHLFNKRDLLTEDQRRWDIVHPEIPARLGKLNNIEKFDAAFFGVHSKQAECMDPMCRLLLEKTFEAILDAGMNPEEVRGSRTGVFIGACFSESEKKWFYETLPQYGFGITGCSRTMLANRIGYWLGTNGPSYMVDTACSSSLYAIDHAYKAIRDGACDIALVGGASLCLHPYISLQFARLGVLSPEGRCKTFDRDANGYARSEAVGMMVLQKSKDARRIYAKVVHSKVNSDGYKTEGITYPSGAMQRKLLQEFYQECSVDPASVSWVEAHGTGTRVGDPEELGALDAVFCKDRKKPLPIGSVKTNLGHTEPASGLCSISKVIIAMETKCIPPTLHYEAPREGVVALENGSVQVVTEPQPWEGGMVGVNSFGFGGANCHVLLDWNHKNKVNGGRPNDNIPRLVTVSSRTEKGLQRILDDLESRPIDAEYLSLFHKIHAINIPGHVYRGYTLLKQGQPSRHTQTFVGTPPPVWFVLSGLDSQWTGMGKSLLGLPSFAAAIARCHKTLKPMGLDLTKILMDDTFDNVIHTLVGITAVQIGLLEVLRSVGIHPDGLVGLSVGELAAGYADGCFTMEQTILAAYYQGLSLLELDVGKGTMASIGVGSEEAKALLPQDIEVAFKNGPGSCIISGPSSSVAMLLKSLSGKGIAGKEIKCNNIAVHSRHIKNVGSKLIKYLQKVIPSPKFRSKKWISTSFPESGWTSQSAKLASAEYLAHSLLSTVLFDNARVHVPRNAVVIEIAPDATLRTTLGELGGVCVSLMDSQRDSIEHLLLTLGTLFECGLQPQLADLYPPVVYPVSRTTPTISHLVDWEHEHDWHVVKYVVTEQFKSGEREVSINVSHEDMAFYTGHVIDGRNLFPATGYLQMAWESIARMNFLSYGETSVVFENIRFHRATNIPKDGQVTFLILVQKGSGNFEVVEGGSAIVTGRVYITDDPAKKMMKLPSLQPARGTDMIELSSKDVYKELRLRGYNYSGLFRSIVSADNLGLTGKIRWKDNWIAFMDNMLQMQILTEDTRGLFVPTAINRLTINTLEHLSILQAMGDDDEKVVDVFVHPEVGVIRSGGVQIHGLKASVISRRKPLGDPVLEKYHFVPNSNYVCKENTPQDMLEALRICMHVGLENQMAIQVKVVELVDSRTDAKKKMPVLAPGVAAVLGDLPLIQADITVLADVSNPLVVGMNSTIKVEDKKLSSEENVLFAIGTDMMGRVDVLQAALGCIGTTGYLISREKSSTPTIQETGINILNEYHVDGEKLVLIKKEGTVLDPIVIHIQEGNFEWVPKLQATIKDEKSPQNILLVSQNESTSGLLGLFNCLRKEPGGQNIRCFLILDKTVPKFSLMLPFYQDQIKKDVAVNVFKNGEWGSYRHTLLEPCPMVNAKHAYVNMESHGDLSTFQWMEGSLDPDCYKPKQYEGVVHLYYSALNFKDVMCATGKLAVVVESSRIRQQNLLGLEFSGVDLNGKRVMGQVPSGGMANMVVADTCLLWDVPDEWSLEDAATVPVVYATAYYALHLIGKMKQGDSVLIHAGSGGVGQAAIHLALHEGCTVYTTVGTQEKRDFIKQRFPQLTDRHIGNSRDTSFEQLVMAETKGRGVDLVLNSLSGEKLLASVRCLAIGGRFLEIGKFDVVNNNPLGMDIFLKETSFHGVMLDKLFNCPPEWKKPLFDIMMKGIKDGAVKPLTRTVFTDDEIEKAFRYMAAGKHIGKVLLKIRDEAKDVSLPPKVHFHQAKPRMCCDPECTYIIAGGLGGFGLELADWLVLRGATKLVLTSRSGLRTGYQSTRVRMWRSYGVTVQISTEDITTRKGVTTLLTEANKLGPVAGIFNLAVVLLDALFENQTEDNFRKSFCPKAEATKHLDAVSRKLCPQLKYFVIFSSVSCGRGNAGQTNYGMANSVMERICEERVQQGYPGVAVQWGAVGDVGLVADMQEEDHELVIGGTLQQRISSCLQVMDGLLRQSHPVVASMVVAEKKMGGGTSGSVVDCIANIIGLRDLKTVSMHSSLAELGMDSMMAVEIKQTLEREFEMFLTPQDIRGLTFAKLIDIANSEDISAYKGGAADEDTFVGLQFLFRAIGDEKDAAHPVFVLPSIADANTPTDLFLIPGIEGMAFLFESLAKNLKFKVKALQLGHWGGNLPEDVSEMASLLLPFVQNSLKSKKKPFQLLGHSFGGLVAMHLALQLEQAGYQGNIVLVDSAPDFVQNLTRFALGGDGNDDNLQVNLLVAILNLIQKQETAFLKQAQSDMAKLQSWDERLEHFLTLVPDSPYSHEYRKALSTSALRRSRAMNSFHWPEGIKLKSSVMLVKPTVQILKTTEDYGLRKYFENPVDIHLAEGDHASILDNPQVAHIVNTLITTRVEELDPKGGKVQKPQFAMNGVAVKNVN